MDHGKSVAGGSGTSDEPCTKTEHWRTGASWTRISRPFPSSLVSHSLFLSPSRLNGLVSRRPLREQTCESRAFSSSLSGVRVSCGVPWTDSWLPQSIQVTVPLTRTASLWVEARQKWTRPRAMATGIRKRRRGRETVPRFCARWNEFNFDQIRYVLDATRLWIKALGGGGVDWCRQKRQKVRVIRKFQYFSCFIGCSILLIITFINRVKCCWNYVFELIICLH